MRYKCGEMNRAFSQVDCVRTPATGGPSLSLVVALLIFAAPSAAAAQTMGTAVVQIGSPQPFGIDQVAGRAPNGDATSQVASVAESAAPARQLTTERGAGPGAAQLSRGPRSAQASSPLSTRADGRTSAVERVAGADRCDPAAARPARADKCTAVIENRAAEFARSDAPSLSPEQRIIVNQQLRERVGMSEAARRLAASGRDADSIEAQGVASVVLAAPPPGPVRDQPKDDPAATAQMQALINALVNRGDAQ